ncbi:MAG: YceI family protein [Planctomycetota bacterium]|jgi:polyisoprenoid-binding protein YceI
MRTLTIVTIATAATLAGTALLSAPTPADARDAAAGEYTIDTVHSAILFKIRHAGGASNFYGRFNTFEGSFSLDPDSPASSSFNVSIDLESIDTANEQRDNHLRSPDFFNTRQFERATFNSTSVDLIEEGVYEVTGDFNLHGTTNPITATVTHIADGTFRGSQRSGFEATFEFNRSDFDITTYIAPDGGDTGPLGNTVTILASFETIRQ